MKITTQQNSTQYPPTRGTVSV